MNFNTIFLTSFRVLLLPLAVLYGAFIKVRNWLFDKQYLSAARFNFPLICVGNLAVGGTGKSPMVEYLLALLHTRYKVATVSRGYKRKTKGYVLAGASTTALEIGDEPMLFHKKFPSVPVAVGEERLDAIPQLLHDNKDLQAIILDDAFQHRSVQAGFNILLTEFGNTYNHDFFLPTGDLRDERGSAKRAQVIIVTKCPTDLTEAQRQKIMRSLRPKNYQRVFFTCIQYETPYHILDVANKRPITNEDEVLLMCGIANPKPLKHYLHEQARTYYQQDYADHHIFSIDDLQDVVRQFDSIAAQHKFIITTEKDAVRLTKFQEELKLLPFYVLPIKHSFLFDEGPHFDELILSFINGFNTNMQHE
ncbi:MAG: tetraacyldisaccharide 4'-kinase [Bacteroidetes bacterium]|nr:tetraacyldisaccharide 4'-kinase [Bacteroidota bacterium]